MLIKGQYSITRASALAFFRFPSAYDHVFLSFSLSVGWTIIYKWRAIEVTETKKKKKKNELIRKSVCGCRLRDGSFNYRDLLGILYTERKGYACIIRSI